MKRETKFGLLIGVAVILLISVVVTDYLSTPSNQQPADFTNFAPAAEQSVIGRTTDSVRSWIHEQTETGQPSTTATGQQPIPLPDEEPRRITPPDRGTEHAAPRHTTPPGRNIEQNNFGSVAERPGYQPYENPQAISERELPVNANVRTQPVVHVVQAGENLYKIAKRYYGNGEYWSSIAQANRAIDNDTGIIIPDQKIVIPNLSNRVNTASNQPRITQVSNTGNSGPQTLVQVTRTRNVITVQPGDSLSRIAERELGDRKHWRLILEANRAILSDPDQIRPGMELVMPTVERIVPVSTRPKESQNGVSSRPVKTSLARPTLGATVPIRREVTTSSVRPDQLTTFTATKPAPSLKRPSPFAGSKTYTVKSGDSLASIARRFYGDHEKWRTIFDANRKLLEDPNDLLVGDVLIIPGR